MNVLASWSKWNSFKIITIQPKTLTVEKNEQCFVEYQRFCSDLKINAKKYKLKWLWKNYAKKYKLKSLWKSYNLFIILKKRYHLQFHILLICSVDRYLNPSVLHIHCNLATTCSKLLSILVICISAYHAIKNVPEMTFQLQVDISLEVIDLICTIKRD